MVGAIEEIDIVFDGPPGPDAGAFVEVEDMRGKSLSAGEWIDRGDGTWALRLRAEVERPAPQAEGA